MTGLFPTDLDVAEACERIYAPDAMVAGFDHFDAGMDDGVCWALKRFPAADLVVFRGSKTLQDWICDARALAIPTRIGHVHAGFYDGMENVWKELRPMLTNPVVAGGHSLGASRAGILTAMMNLDDVPVHARVVFGEPKPGLLDLARMVLTTPSRSYRNGDETHHDLVTDVPFSFPPEQYVHPTPIIPVCCRPQGDAFAQVGVFAWHHMALYRQAIANLPDRIF